MASHSVARSKHATLSAATVDTITITGLYRNFRVQNRASTGTISYTHGATTAATPTADGDDTFDLPAGATDEWTEEILGAPATGRVVKLISAATPAYSVEAW